MQLNLDAMEQRLQSPPYARVLESLQEVGFNSLYGLLGTYGAQRSDLAGWLQDAQINRDGNLRLQYLAGMALNRSMEALIYNEILAARQFPKNLFTGSPEALQKLTYNLQAQANQ